MIFMEIEHRSFLILKYYINIILIHLCCCEYLCVKCWNVTLIIIILSNDT